MSSQEQPTTTTLVAEVVQVPTKVVLTPEKMFLKGRTWAQMIADEEEEEEQERLREEQEKMKNILAARKFLYSIGQYELEEGEILE